MQVSQRRRTLLRLVGVGSFLLLCIYIFSGGSQVPGITTTIPSVTRTIKSTSYDVNYPPACWAQNCTKKNNWQASLPCSFEEANRLLAHGVDAMERYVSAKDASPSLYSQKYLDIATKYFEDTLALEPNCVSAQVNLALCEMQSSSLEKDDPKIESAIARIEKAITLAPGVSRHYVIRGFLKELQGHWEKAKEDWNQALHYNPFICERRYMGVMVANDTRMKWHKKKELCTVTRIPAEKIALRDILIFIEFSPVSLSDYPLLSSLEHESFVKKRFAILQNIIPPFIFPSISKFYYEAIHTEKILGLDDGQSKRYYIANDRIARFLQYSYTDLLRKVIAHNGLPSYTYFGGYIEGAELAPHADRQQCEFTFSLTVYQNPPDEPWPLALGSRTRFERDKDKDGGYLDFPPADEHVVAPLMEGDALLFMGRHLIHWRIGKQKPNHETYNIFIHYVPSDFASTLE